jgi:hypothetical protein
MQVALDNSLDHEAWLALNTAFCQRHRCRLTVADCDSQRLSSQGESGDLRCQSCGGLDDQPEAIDEIGEYGKTTQRHLKLVTPPVSVDAAAQIDPFAVMLLSILNEKDYVVEAEFEPVEEELDYAAAYIDEDDLDDEVMQLFPELRGFIEECNSTPIAAENESRRERPGSKSNHCRDKYAVYMGRCERCGGYMDNTRETQFAEKWDDDVHRCLACGWRTSPAYAWNRENPHLAGWKG